MSIFPINLLHVTGRYCPPVIVSSALILFLLVFPGVIQASNPACGDGELCNPLKVQTIKELLLAILNIIKVIMVPIIMFFIVYAGFLFVTAQGNPEEVNKAKRALLYAVIGGVIIIGAEAITTIVENVVADFEA